LLEDGCELLELDEEGGPLLLDDELLDEELLLDEEELLLHEELLELNDEDG
jgi:hypothetical protein